MATCRFTTGGTADNTSVRFNPVSSALANLPNAAGTIVALVRNNTNGDIVGLLNNPPTSATAWYHVLQTDGSAVVKDDDGIVGCTFTGLTIPTGSTADDFRIAVIDWPAGGAALERGHVSAGMGSAESWTNVNSAANNGGTRAGPTTAAGTFTVGALNSISIFTGDVAVVAVWAGIRFTDTDVTNLWVSKNTSDWWNHPAGQPTTLVELTTLTPVDIGANPSTFSATGSAVALTGLNPTGWTFDGQGSATGLPNRANVPRFIEMRRN